MGVELIEELVGGQPQWPTRQIRGHLAALNRLDPDLLRRFGNLTTYGALSHVRTASESGEVSGQRRTRPHRRRCLSPIGQIVTASIHRLTLRGDQFSINLG